ncbi:MAG: CRISPR-associated endoribonuclease Cas2 [Methanosaeta sp. PtaB.Bin018]|nr:MAG: CRISPR-associated endoribonuclease Cas2 [Methanosaeta sp. PtaB.Bin018]
MSGLNCYVVSYDIREQKRLYRVHRAMMGFGEPVHYSVFRCDLTLKGKVEMVAALENLIVADEDRIMIIDLGPNDGKVEERIEFIGIHAQHMELLC